MIPGRFFLANLVERRSLIAQLVRRDFDQRFAGSIGGWLWGLVHPLVLLLSYSFVFGVCLGMNQRTPNYPFFLFAGMLPWLLFSETVQRSASGLIDQANLITKTVFPAEVVPVSIFLSSLVSHLMALGMVVIAIGMWLNHLSPALLVLPVYTFLLGLFAIGIGWIFSSLQVYLRDTAQILSVILTAWFWLTPIFITEDQIPAGLRFLLGANPVAFAVRAYRDMLLSYRSPDWSDLGWFTVYAVGAFFLGGLFFRHMKRGFADVL
ncbi:MAG: ABC transporter permease [Acidobacteria bacterium]|nr:ABC transporter permease [Acidobacteriota bacterium]